MTAPARKVVIKVLDAPWLPLQSAERELRGQVVELRAERASSSPSLWSAINADIAGVLDAATQVREMWTRREREVDFDDLVGEVGWESSLFDHFGSLPPLAAVLPEQGFRFYGLEKSVFLRFADSTSTEDPEVVWLAAVAEAISESAS